MRFFSKRSKMNFILILFVLTNFIFCSTGAIHKKAKEHNYQAVKLINDNNLEMAEKHLELALEYNKNYAEAYNNLGIIYLRQNRVDRAERYFSLAIEYNSDFAEAHNNMGYIFLIKGDFKKAEQRFKSALSIDPAFVNARLNLARTYLLSQEYKKAESELLKLKILSDDEEVYILLINLYVKMGRVSDSFSLLDEMISNDKMNTKGFYLRGYLNLVLNRCNDAIEDFEMIKNDYLKQKEFYINYSAAYICLKDYQKAEAILNKALFTYSDDPSLLFNLGKIHYEKENYQTAVDYFKKSYELGFSQACFYLLDTLFKLNKKDESSKLSFNCK